VISHYRNTVNSQLNIPKKEDGSAYALQELTEEQLEIACTVIEKLKEWLEFSEKQQSKTFNPLRMTVAGAAGSGKSRVINTLVTVIRQILQDNNSVHVIAPTGAAAFNVGGQTIHRLFKINVANPDKPMGNMAKEQLGAQLRTTVALFFDERSMISQKVLGAAEMNASAAAHNFGHDSEDWGGIPIVILFGDDCQIPPTLAAGAFESLSGRNQTKLGVASNGRQQFWNLSKQVMELKMNNRQQPGQQHFLDILKNCRVGTLSRKHCETLMSLHLNNFSPEKVEAIKRKSTYIFANRDPMRLHNTEMLRREHSAENPVARIRSKITTQTRNTNQNTTHFKDNPVPIITNLCRNARVQITGRNLEPDWGLYNGAIGTVKEIVYEHDKSPIGGDLPEFVLVEFTQYCGPPWITDKPKVTPYHLYAFVN